MKVLLLRGQEGDTAIELDRGLTDFAVHAADRMLFGVAIGKQVAGSRKHQRGKAERTCDQHFPNLA